MKENVKALKGLRSVAPNVESWDKTKAFSLGEGPNKARYNVDSHIYHF